MFENIEHDSSFAQVCYIFFFNRLPNVLNQSCVTAVVKKIVSQVIWDVHVSLTALRTLNTVGQLYDKIEDADKVFIGFCSS